MEKLEIKTKQVFNLWFSTLDYHGKHYSVGGITPELAQGHMRNVIHANKWNPDHFHFSEPISNTQIKENERRKAKFNYSNGTPR